MSKKNKRKKMKAQAPHRSIDASLLKAKINDSAKKKNTPEAKKIADRICEIIDLQPTYVAHKEELLASVFNAIKSKINDLDRKYYLSIIDRDTYFKEIAKVNEDITDLENKVAKALAV